MSEFFFDGGCELWALECLGVWEEGCIGEVLGGPLAWADGRTE